MKHTNPSRFVLIVAAIGSAILTPVLKLSAAVYGGEGLDYVPRVDGLPTGADPVGLILSILETVLSYLALAAVIIIIIAGIRMIFSQGDEEQVGKARKTIIYVALGLAVIVLADLIVSFVLSSLNASNLETQTAITGVVRGGDVRQTILHILEIALSFLALVAVIIIIIAGIRLVVSQGNEEQKDKARKTIIYVVIGLIVIVFSRAIVAFAINFFTTNP